MRIYEFPFVFEQSTRNDLQTNISARKSQSASKINDLRRSIKKKPDPMGMALFTSFGSMGGLIACAWVSCDGDIWGNTGFGAGFLTFVIWVVIATGLGWAIDFAAQKKWNDETNSIDSQIAYISDETDKSIVRAERECDNECRRYAEAFEKSAQEMSVQYAASSLVQSVISWMTSEFYRAIVAADRRSHIESISVPFVFDVYTNKITCNLGTFDFELQRCQNLNSPLEQASLARAIASSLQLNVVKKYPKDVTGSSVDVNISFSYEQDRPIVTVSYIAQNFNYKPVSVW